MLLRTGGHTYHILWGVCHEGAGEQFHTGNTLRQTVIHKQGRLTGDRFGVTRRGYCYSTDKNDDPKCARAHPYPEVLSLKGSPKFCSLHPQGSKDHSRPKQSLFQRCGAGGEGAQSQKVSLGSTPSSSEGLPTTDILLQGKPHQKGSYNLVGSGLVDIHGNGPETSLD